ncbi:hypothetical protein BDW02DRAFT_40455 [Decorospora gaudefroyi]|uniref:Uncharacterized protein n=1 Tax=Decorospora gaudefroyi TaxID=184978 RepID=A0A6A5K9G2_9PLEO|nr:hypothetical protein BDW02DRAFT_40455 [Decorospora gaudefroyi]
MAAQDDGRRKAEDERWPPPWFTEKDSDDEDDEDDDDDEDDSPVTSSPEIVLSKIPVAETTMAPPPPPTFLSSTATTSESLASPIAQSPSGLSHGAYPSMHGRPPWASPSFSSVTQSWHTSTSVATPYLGGLESSTWSTTPTLLETSGATSPTNTTGAYDGGPPGWDWSRKHANDAPMYAAAAVVPIVVLAIVGAVTLVCLRRRKKRKAEAAAAQTIAQEMKMQPQSIVQPYMAPPPPVMPISHQYSAPPSQLPPTSTPSQFQPVILGPIGSGSNGAYLTGIDTSDMVSVTSNTLRPADPFAGNNSLTEPPPPYRPQSVAPPSFTSTSRQSSLRASAPPSVSQTYLIQRSPFDDPDNDDDEDAVSELSGPTTERDDDDAMSAVSDLSYQRDPFTGRRPL